MPPEVTTFINVNTEPPKMSEVRLTNICYVLGEGHYTIYKRGKIYTKNLNRKWLCFYI